MPSHLTSDLELYAGETCPDCADHIEAQRRELPGLTGPALHIAVGALYGGSSCDHVDYDGSDMIRAYEALWSHALRERDRARAEAGRLRKAIETHRLQRGPFAVWKGDRKLWSVLDGD